MGFLASAEAIVARAVARAMAPPPPPDITRWCEENIEFDERSPLPGKFRIERFPFLREIHEVLSPEHPAREVTVRGSAQWGKTVSVIQPTIAAWHSSTALDSLVVHPTMSAATEWVNNKWLPMRRQAPDLRRVFGDARSGEKKDTTFNQETVDRNGSLKVASSGSPADLTGTSRRLVVMDDLSKYEPTPLGDPEALAVSRASGFEDAKILRVSTPMISGTCRITRSFNRGDRRFYHVPCPHCGHEAPLTWENFRRNLDPERLAAAHFTCDACGCVIGHADKERIVAAGRWVAHNAAGDHPSFHLWRAYAPQRDWASIAHEYAQVMGWSRLEVTAETEAGLATAVEAETEQTFWNDVLGLPYEQASKGPDWEALRDRVENADPADQRPRGIVPSRGVILTCGVDCQADRIELHVVAFGEQYRRWTVDYVVIPHHIGDDEGRAALDAYLKATWRTEKGLRLPLDMLAIDGGTYTEDVWSWAKRHPWNRVIIVKGSSSQTGPILTPQKFERRADGKAKRRQKRAFMLNVSQLKADFYTWLAKDDPLERGFVAFPVGLGDEYFRQITSEVRVIKRSRAGVATSQWDLVEPTRRNEGLDTMNYAEAAARRKGWTSNTADQWAVLEAQRAAEPQDAQADLFDAAVPAAPAVAPTPTRPAQPTAAEAKPDQPADDGTWIPTRSDWI
ncbi:phage terminase large subunit family protein [Pelagovum pacificum]|uniref:Terminase n=1 Tax=Pelagovum pacificum TaxID=2588711 RepID=A0A5C5GFF5_9RHOB|nr:terminase gpA endonuclease subunit [Pelagovum pacificum]QQA43947.1 phage terminase large subunit family protein [Pelagovum pacificum]TNY32924.1 terminase [Pelagovum pacificum]